MSDKKHKPAVGGLNVRDHLTNLAYQVYGLQLQGVPRPFVAMSVEATLVVLMKVVGITLGAAAKPNGDIDINIALKDELAERLFQDRLRRKAEAAAGTSQEQ